MSVPFIYSDNSCRQFITRGNEGLFLAQEGAHVGWAHYHGLEHRALLPLDASPMWRTWSRQMIVKLRDEDYGYRLMFMIDALAGYGADRQYVDRMRVMVRKAGQIMFRMLDNNRMLEQCNGVISVQFRGVLKTWFIFIYHPALRRGLVLVTLLPGDILVEMENMRKLHYRPEKKIHDGNRCFGIYFNSAGGSYVLLSLIPEDVFSDYLDYLEMFSGTALDYVRRHLAGTLPRLVPVYITPTWTLLVRPKLSHLAQRHGFIDYCILHRSGRCFPLSPCDVDISFMLMSFSSRQSPPPYDAEYARMGLSHDIWKLIHLPGSIDSGLWDLASL